MTKGFWAAMALFVLMTSAAVAQPPWARSRANPRVHYGNGYVTNPRYPNNLPPGLQKQLYRRGHLPPGQEKKLYNSAPRYYGSSRPAWRWDPFVAGTAPVRR